MAKILSLESSVLSDFTKQIYYDVKSGSTNYGNVDYRVDQISGTSHYVVHLNAETVELVNQSFPFIESTVVFIEQQPGYVTPHVDGTIEWGYPYNLVVPVTNISNTSTVYYENNDLVYNEAWKTTGSKYFRDIDKLTKIFEFTFTDPIIFFNQQLHSMFNHGSDLIVVGTWKLLKDIKTDDVVQWADKQGIVSTEVY